MSTTRAAATTIEITWEPKFLLFTSRNFDFMADEGVGAATSVDGPVFVDTQNCPFGIDIAAPDHLNRCTIQVHSISTWPIQG